MSNSLQPHGWQHARLLHPILSPGVCSNSCSLSWCCHPTISSADPFSLLPSVFPSIRVFSSETVLCIRWTKYWSFSISPSNEYSGLISFQMDWFDLLAIQGTLKSLLQHHNSKATILQSSTFFIVQLSHPYMTTGKKAAAESARLRWRRSGREKLPHARGQGRWLRGATLRPSSGGCAGTGAPRGATPRSRSGGVAVRRYPSSKVRSSGCALLEQPSKDTPRSR